MSYRVIEIIPGREITLGRLHSAIEQTKGLSVGYEWDRGFVCFYCGPENVAVVAMKINGTIQGKILTEEEVTNAGLR
jgi:hypothetical protein